MTSKRSPRGGFASVSRRAFGACLFGLGIVHAVQAQEVAKWYLNIAAGLYEYDQERLFENDSAGIFGIERRLTPNWAVELRTMSASFKNEQATVVKDGRLIRNSLDALYYFSDGKGFEPYLSSGIGSARFSMGSGERNSETDLSLAVGTRYLFNPKWSLRAEARYFNTLSDNYGDTLISFGVSYSFGRIGTPPKQATATQVVTPPVISTPPVSPQPGEWTIRFAFNSAELTDPYQESLGQVAHLIKTTTGSVVLIEGHTDNIGTASYNLQLSQRRVKAVEKRLVDAYGVEPLRLRTAWQGEARPVADNDTAEGRSQNRRVLIVVEDEGK